MKVKDLKKLLGEMSEDLDDADVLINSDHHGIEIAEDIWGDQYYLDQGYYEKELYDEDELDDLDPEDRNNTKKCIVISY